MSDQPLKLGWTVHEVIGIAVVNPRALSGAAGMPKELFGDNRGYIEVRSYSIEINGALEAAALAFAEDILKSKRWAGDVPNDRWRYHNVIEVRRDQNVFTVNLTEQGLGLIDPDLWASFKKSVEKICNDLPAFI